MHLKMPAFVHEHPVMTGVGTVAIVGVGYLLLHHSGSTSAPAAGTGGTGGTGGAGGMTAAELQAQMQSSAMAMQMQQQQQQLQDQMTMQNNQNTAQLTALEDQLKASLATTASNNQLALSENNNSTSATNLQTTTSGKVAINTNATNLAVTNSNNQTAVDINSQNQQALIDQAKLNDMTSVTMAGIVAGEQTKTALAGDQANIDIAGINSQTQVQLGAQAASTLQEEAKIAGQVGKIQATGGLISGLTGPLAVAGSLF